MKTFNREVKVKNLKTGQTKYVRKYQTKACIKTGWVVCVDETKKARINPKTKGSTPSLATSTFELVGKGFLFPASMVFSIGRIGISLTKGLFALPINALIGIGNSIGFKLPKVGATMPEFDLDINYKGLTIFIVCLVLATPLCYGLAWLLVNYGLR